MQTAKNLKGYRRELRNALDDSFLSAAMENFAVAYRTGRKNAFSGMDVDALVETVATAKDDALARMDALFNQFKASAEKKGIHVHLAGTADEANEMIEKIARVGNAKQIIKSKSMTAEETLLNHHLEKHGFQVTETDLGEWIIQLRGEGPSHMVMPAIHLSRYQVADLFTGVTGKTQASEIERLVKVARRELRQKFVEADMGISGANFAVADTGTIGLVTNEGNARLVTTLPGIHVALVGLDKLVPTLDRALDILRILPRNATGQQITSYVTWITGANECAAGSDNRKEMHIVFLDNGRRRLARDPVFSQVLRCVRCGACANVCPVYRMVGGHRYGHIYIGAIGLILTYFFHGREKAKHLVQNCLNCGACKDVCAAGIDLPRLIQAIHARIQDEGGHPVQSTLLGKVLRNRKLFHRLLRTAAKTQRPVTGGSPYLRHLPMLLSADHHFRALPAIAETPFRDLWPALRPEVKNPLYRVALFSGCVQDFVYPGQLIAAVRLMADRGVALEFPMDQSCCGLPVEMMGETDAARAVARQNLAAMTSGSRDYIVTLCASCASHLKNAYPRILAGAGISEHQVKDFVRKVVPFSQFMNDILVIEEEVFQTGGKTATFHAPCHLCRGLGVTEAPRDLIQKAGYRFVPAAEEQTCCGFGGTYSGKFPAISARILARKLDDVRATGADLLVTECPGCVMQLRGGALKRGERFEVKHIAEALGDAAKQPFYRP
jgi:iron-sulfur cluster protein